MRCVVTLGAILPQLLKCSMPSCVSLDLSSSIFPLMENLVMSVICLPLVPSLALYLKAWPLFSWCYFGSICRDFYGYSIMVIVAEMTDFWIVLQVFISIFLKIFFFSQVNFVQLSLLTAVFRLNQLLVLFKEEMCCLYSCFISHPSFSPILPSYWVAAAISVVLDSCSWTKFAKELWNGFQSLVCAFFHSKCRLNQEFLFCVKCVKEACCVCVFFL